MPGSVCVCVCVCACVRVCVCDGGCALHALPATGATFFVAAATSSAFMGMHGMHVTCRMLRFRPHVASSWGRHAHQHQCSEEGTACRVHARVRRHRMPCACVCLGAQHAGCMRVSGVVFFFPARPPSCHLPLGHCGGGFAIQLLRCINTTQQSQHPCTVCLRTALLAAVCNLTASGCGLWRVLCTVWCARRRQARCVDRNTSSTRHNASHSD
jgi:hypothetical protein